MLKPEQTLRKLAIGHTRHQFVDLSQIGVPECPEIDVICSRQSLRPWAEHTHGELAEVCFLAAGQRVYRRGGRTSFMRGGDLWVNPPGLLHSAGVHPSGASLFYNFFLRPPVPGAYWGGLPPDMAARAWRRMMNDSPDVYRAMPETRTFFDRLFAAAKNERNPDRDLRVRLAFNALLFTVCDGLARAAHAAMHPRVRAAIDQLDLSDPAVQVDIAALAEETGLSTSYFKKAFRDGMGITPGRYLLHRRLVAAARRLCESELPSISISQMYGFSSSQHFTTAFHRYFCVTPRRYRLAGGSPLPLHITN